jgi:hypothetical protein
MTCEPAPASLTRQQKDTICGILSVGCDRQTAADYVGCSLADMRCQMQHDGQFLADVRRAEAGTELSHMRIVQETAKTKKDWRASVWWLERRSPERFARRSPGAITMRQLKSFVAILVDALRENIASHEDRDRVIARLKAIAESVEQMLLDAHAIPTEPLDAEQSCEDVTADSTSSGSFVQRLLSFEGMD